MEATIARTHLGSLSTPDLVLSFIPGPLVASVALAVALGVPLSVTLAAGGLVASVAVGYALFYAPPVDRAEPSDHGSRGHRQ